MGGKSYGGDYLTCSSFRSTSCRTLALCVNDLRRSESTLNNVHGGMINEFRCYEAKIEGSEKAGSRRESNPGHPWLEPAGFFTSLYFRLVTSKFIYFQREARCSEHGGMMYAGMQHIVGTSLSGCVHYNHYLI